LASPPQASGPKDQQREKTPWWLSQAGKQAAKKRLPEESFGSGKAWPRDALGQAGAAPTNGWRQPDNCQLAVDELPTDRRADATCAGKAG
jgi:hypothetical protein